MFWHKIKTYLRSCLIGSGTIFNGQHDCGPRALCQILPHLKQDSVKEAFLYSSKLWPYGGVTNKDFNIALRYLRIINLFEYKGYEETCMPVANDFRNKKNDTFILLIYGHYTVVRKGKIIDRRVLAKNISKEQVYCSWKLRN